MDSVVITPLTPTVGAEVTGLRATDLDTDVGLRTRLVDAFHQHHVLVFRDQELDREQHKTFGRHFGELHIHPSKRGPDAKGDPHIFTVGADETTTQNNGGRWHADVTCDDIPPLGSLLYLKVAPPTGGDTMFTNMHQAYETLSAPIQRLLLGLTAVHDQIQDLRWYGYEPRPGADYPKSSHPVVVAHPETGRPTLFVNEAFTTRIEGLSPHESDSLLRMLYHHIAQNPALQCRVRWAPGTIVLWDNRSVQHFAVWDYFPQVRRGERVTVAGTVTPAAYATT